MAARAAAGALARERAEGAAPLDSIVTGIGSVGGGSEWSNGYILYLLDAIGGGKGVVSSGYCGGGGGDGGG